MKKIILLVVPILFAIKSWGQTNPFEASEVYWYGLDFTKSKMVGNFSQFGDAGVKNGFDIRNIYFRSWNRTIVSESEKYTLDKFLNVSKVNYALSVTEAVNQDMDASKLMLLDTYSKELTAEEIQNCVNQYKIEQKSGIGVVFIIEKFDRFEEKGVMNVVYFDIASKKVLFAKRMSGEPKGIGLNNYWIRSVYNVMLEVKERQPEWKRNYK
jgi:hypothetical protein